MFDVEFLTLLIWKKINLLVCQVWVFPPPSTACGLHISSVCVTRQQLCPWTSVSLLLVIFFPGSWCFMVFAWPPVKNRRWYETERPIVDATYVAVEWLHCSVRPQWDVASLSCRQTGALIPADFLFALPSRPGFPWQLNPYPVCHDKRWDGRRVKQDSLQGAFLSLCMCWSDVCCICLVNYLHLCSNFTGNCTCFNVNHFRGLLVMSSNVEQKSQPLWTVFFFVIYVELHWILYRLYQFIKTNIKWFCEPTYVEHVWKGDRINELLNTSQLCLCDLIDDAILPMYKTWSVQSVRSCVTYFQIKPEHLFICQPITN